MNTVVFPLLLLMALFSAAIHSHCDGKDLPDHVDLSTEFEKLKLPPRAQGNRDVCSLFAITALANFEYARSQPESHTQFSEEFLIWAAKKATGKTGEQAMFYEAVCGLNHFGISADRLMPYAKNADANHKPSPPALADAHQLSDRWSVNWIKRWNLTNPLTDHQVHQIKQALAAHHPVACGMRWPKKDMGHQLLRVPPANEVEDGHSIVLTGYIDDPNHNGDGKFLFRNSWGAGWGNHGYGEMSYGYVRAYANDSLWLHFGGERAEVPTFRFEAESLPVVARNHCETHPQNMNDFRGTMWSGNTQLFCAASRGNYVELAFNVTNPGRYRVRVLATAAPDFGIVRIGFPTVPPSHDFDLYSGRVCPSGSLELGKFDFNAAKYVLRFTSINKNHSSGGFQFGIDAIDLLADK
jgi:hypothetical protein